VGVRSRASCLALLLCLPLAGCVSLGGWLGNLEGEGVAELPANEGWQRLPLGRWLLDDGIAPAALVICPAQLCTHVGMAAILEAEGPDALKIEADLADDRMLSRRNAPTKPRIIGGGRARKVSNIKAQTHIQRSMLDGMAVTSVALTPQSSHAGRGQASARGPNRAYAVVLSQRFGPRLKLAIAITTDPDIALIQARAAAREW
jgi:hypothetical protein